MALVNENFHLLINLLRINSEAVWGMVEMGIVHKARCAKGRTTMLYRGQRTTEQLCQTADCSTLDEYTCLTGWIKQARICAGSSSLLYDKVKKAADARPFLRCNDRLRHNTSGDRGAVSRRRLLL